MRYLTALCILLLWLIASCKAPAHEDRNLDLPDTTSVSRLITVSVSFTPQWYHQAQFAGFYMAQKKGFYHNFGLNVIIKPGSTESPGAKVLNEGTSDFSTLFLLTAMREFASGNRLVNIAQLSQQSSLMLVGKKSSGIQSISSLNNKRVGLWRSDFHELSKIFLANNKLTVDLIPIDNSIDIFVSGAVDAMNVMEYNELHQLYQAGYNPEELWTYFFKSDDLSIPEDGIYTTEEFYTRYPDICKDFADASLQGWIYAINHPEETLDVVMEVMKEAFLPANRPHQSWMLGKIRESILAKHDFGKLHRSDFDRTNKILLDNGMIDKAIEYHEFYPNAE